MCTEIKKEAADPQPKLQKPEKDAVAEEVKKDPGAQLCIEKPAECVITREEFIRGARRKLWNEFGGTGTCREKKPDATRYDRKISRRTRWG
jgi:hypothetical protein